MNKIKIPRGTIIKIDNSTVKLTKSLHAYSDGKTILLEEEMINTDFMTLKGTDMESTTKPIIDQQSTSAPSTLPSTQVFSVLESTTPRDNLINAAAIIATNPNRETELLIKKAVKYLHLEFDEAIKELSPEKDKNNEIKPVIIKDSKKTK